MIPIAMPSAIETALSLVWRHWKIILGAVVVGGLSIALLIAKSDARHWRKMHDNLAANYKVAQADAARAQSERNRAIEQEYARKADEAEDRHAKQIASITDRTNAYIAANRVQQNPKCTTSGAGSSAESSGASVSAPVPADSLVAVTADDLHACSAAVAYALAAHEWAKGLTSEK